MDKLNETLKSRAVDLGLCEQWQKEWNEDWDYDKLISKFYVGIDFCLSNKYPTNDFIKNNFPIDILRRKSVLVDEKRSVLNAPDMAVFGSSEVVARYNARNCGRIYIKDVSSLKITAHNNAFVIVHILDNAKVYAEAYEKADLIIIKHSIDCAITANDSVRIVEEYNLY